MIIHASNAAMTKIKTKPHFIYDSMSHFTIIFISTNHILEDKNEFKKKDTKGWGRVGQSEIPFGG